MSATNELGHCVWLGFLAAICLVVLLYISWAASATTAGKECEKVGAFYVAGKVYDCRLRTEPKP